MTEQPKKRGRKPGFHHSKETRQKISRARQTHGVWAAVVALRKGKAVIDRRTAIGRDIWAAYETLLHEECGSPPSQIEATECELWRDTRLILQLIANDLLTSESVVDKKWLVTEFRQYKDSLGRSHDRIRNFNQSKPKAPSYDDFVAGLKDAKPEDNGDSN